MHTIDSAIIKTLCYADIFDYPLTINQLVKKLITSKPIAYGMLKKYLQKLHQQGTICKTGSYFHLPHRGKTVTIRLQRQKYSLAKKQLAKKIASKLIKLPYIKAVFLTGAVAVGNATVDDDIDLMIVTTPNRLWTARLLVTLWLDIQGLRRRPTMKNINNKFCTNLFVTEDSLKVPLTQQSLYTAHEVIQTQALTDPHRILDKFLLENSWINNYFANVAVSTETPPNYKQLSRDLIEKIVEKIQRMYMEPKRTREIVSQNKAYFHPRDTAGIVLHEFNKKCQLYKL